MGVTEAIAGPCTPSRVLLWRRERWSQLIPHSTSPGDIRSLDGLRAVAALSVLTFHAIDLTHDHLLLAGADLSFLTFYLQTGVHLFFILSGFLLFLPFARAMLDARPLPSARRFYQRRALRILPAYLVCLAIIVLVALPNYMTMFGLQDILVHLALVHDDVYAFNRSIQGAFWTLAVEAQFYLILPLVAFGVSRIVGASRSVGRLIVGVLAFIVAALGLRMLDAIVAARRLTMAPGALARAMSVFLRVTLGAQGKFLEVFGVGMLCGVLHVAAERSQWMRRAATRFLGVACFIAGLGAIVGLAAVDYRKEIAVPFYFLVVNRRDILTIVGPCLVGCGYALLVLGVLWSGRILRGVFEGRIIVFVGLISYSLYLWQGPLLWLSTPFLVGISAHLRIGASLVVNLLITIPVAYLSYQFVERPFLRRRQHLAQAIQQREETPVAYRERTHPNI